MRILLDTELLLWWLLDSEHLPESVVDAVDGAEGPVFVSQASLWEMAIKVSIGKLRVDLPLLVEAAERTGFHWLAIKYQHLIAVGDLEQCNDHWDPFDRLLVAQSRAEPLVLLTHNEGLAGYGETVRIL